MRWLLALTLTLTMMATTAYAQPGSGTLEEAARLNEQVVQLYRAGRYGEAVGVASRVLAIREQALGPNHPDTATSLGNLAKLYQAMGRHDDALPPFQRSLAINEQALGPNHPSTASGLDNLALLYQAMGRHDDALPLFQRALAIDEQALGPNHPDTATDLHNLAGLYKAMERYDDALPLYQRALAIYEQALGPNHPHTAVSLNSLASLYQDMGRQDDALPLFQRALAIKEQALGPNHPSTAASLNNLALLYQDVGRQDDALPLFQRALAIHEQALGPNHPSTATSLNNLAFLYQDVGRYDDALPPYQRALVIREQALGPNHPDTATSLNNLARLQWARRRVPEVLGLFRRAAEAQLVHLRTVTGSLGADASQAASTSDHLDDWLVTLAGTGNATAMDLAARYLLLRRARSASTQTAMLRAARSQLGPEGIGRLDALQAARSQYAALLGSQAPDESARGVLRQQQDAARRRIESLTEALARDTEAFRAEEQGLDSIVETVQQRLGVRDALIELVVYSPYRPLATGAARWGDSEVAAFVLRRTGAPRWVHLGSAEAMATRVAAYHDVLRQPSEAARGLRISHPGTAAPAPFLEAGVTLHDALFAPLRTALGDARRVLIVPDGAAHRVPFDALIHRTGEGPNDWRFLVEEGFTFTRLATGRQLLRGSVGTPTAPIVLAPFADRSLPEHVGRLPGTAREARTVAELLGVAPGLGRNVAPALLRSLRSPRVLHLATHGWVSERLTGAAGSSGRVEDLLQVSGLAFAPGPNDPLDRAHLRTIPASELALLDLGATELVVLSACSTNLGPVRDGEGVFSVQHAFSLAGARAVVSSLWDVSDEATAGLMTAFYQGVLAGRSAPNALNAAMRAHVSESRRSNGNLHPSLWAPFSVVGPF